jgi:archaetidylinositol phosphate synthase
LVISIKYYESGNCILSNLTFLHDGSLRAFKMRSPIRIDTSIMAGPERRLLVWLCTQMPSAVTPDRLTASALGGAAIVFVSYLATRIDPAFFWLASLGLIMHWFGDSLDGSLARYRRIERPRYGYFLDQSIDAISILLIVVGLGLSAYVRLDMALCLLVGYFMLCIYVVLYLHITGYHQMSFLGFGPTEMRVVLIGLNIWMYFAGTSKVVIGSQTLSSYDFVLCGGGIISICLFAANVQKVVRQLRRDEALPDQAGRMGHFARR